MQRWTTGQKRDWKYVHQLGNVEDSSHLGAASYKPNTTASAPWPFKPHNNPIYNDTNITILLCRNCERNRGSGRLGDLPKVTLQVGEEAATWVPEHYDSKITIFSTTTKAHKTEKLGLRLRKRPWGWGAKPRAMDLQDLTFLENLQK